MEVTHEDVESITTAVWATMVEAELSPDPTAASNLEASHVGVVSLSGAYAGLVSVHLCAGLVRGAASVMFGVPSRDVNDEQMVDAVAELTNMVGGNIKCLVEQPTKLGLPTVSTEKSMVESALASSVAVAEVGFSSLDGGLVVTLHRESAA